MKFLKKFDESENFPNKNEILDIIELISVDIIDDGYKIDLSFSEDSIYISKMEISDIIKNSHNIVRDISAIYTNTAMHTDWDRYEFSYLDIKEKIEEFMYKLGMFYTIEFILFDIVRIADLKCQVSEIGKYLKKNRVNYSLYHNKLNFIKIKIKNL